jgi:hypothetical protein
MTKNVEISEIQTTAYQVLGASTTILSGNKNDVNSFDSKKNNAHAEKARVKAFLKTLQELYPDDFEPAVKEFMDEKRFPHKQDESVDMLLEQIIDEDFAEYGEVFKALA